MQSLPYILLTSLCCTLFKGMKTPTKEEKAVSDGTKDEEADSDGNVFLDFITQI